MKKNVFFKTAVLCLSMLAVGMSFTACDDDDDNDPAGSKNEMSKVKAEYSVMLSEAWYTFFDVEVVYTSVAGQDTITLTEDWVYTMDIPYSAAPESFICNVTAKPKENVPAIVPDSSYTLNESTNARVSGILENGAEDDNYGYIGNNETTKTVPSKGMEKYIKGEHRLFSFSYTPEKKNK